MAKTYTLNSYNIGTPAQTTIANAKSMLGIINAHATRLVKIWRVWVVPSPTVPVSAVTGIMVNFALRRLATLTAGTAVTPVAHDTANTSVDLTSITTVTGGTAGTPTVIFDWMLSSEEIVVSGATNNNIACFYPLALAWDTTGDSSIEPITLRQNQGFDIQCVTNSTAGNFDCIIEFTVE